MNRRCPPSPKIQNLLSLKQRVESSPQHRRRVPKKIEFHVQGVHCTELSWDLTTVPRGEWRSQKGECEKSEVTRGGTTRAGSIPKKHEIKYERTDLERVASCQLPSHEECPASSPERTRFTTHAPRRAEARTPRAWARSPTTGPSIAHALSPSGAIS